eukprot:scaffold108632_cov32-Prasinocladus_malaysianus.AAC.1
MERLIGGTYFGERGGQIGCRGVDRQEPPQPKGRAAVLQRCVFGKQKVIVAKCDGEMGRDND